MSRRVLVLHYWSDLEQPMRPAIRHHLHVLDDRAGLQLHYHNVARGVPALLARVRFDSVVLHTTLLGCRWLPCLAEVRRSLAWLRDCDAVKIALPQDEYDCPEILDDWLSDCKVQWIGSNFDESIRPLLYPRMHTQARFFHCLTGYIHEPTARASALTLEPMHRRPLDIVYRAARLPFWFGSHGQLKYRVGEVVARHIDDADLRCDLSTRPEDVIATDRWFAFLASSRTVLGCESGSSVLDTRGAIRRSIEAMLRREPGLTFEDVSRRLPAGWDSHRLGALGPRHFEAIITRTCQILVEGEYSGVLTPHRHYVPLRRDLGDLGEALAMVRDHDRLQQIADRAYEDIFLSGRHTYASLAEKLETALPAPQRPRLRTPWIVVRGSLRAAGAWQSLTRPKLWRTARLLLTDPTLLRCLRVGKGIVDRKRLLKDLIRLAILKRAHRASPERAGYAIDASWHVETNHLQLTSYSVGEIPATAGASMLTHGEKLQITLDHRAIGGSLTYPWIADPSEFPLEDQGIWEFRALGELARTHSAQVTAALGDWLSIAVAPRSAPIGDRGAGL